MVKTKKKTGNGAKQVVEIDVVSRAGAPRRGRNRNRRNRRRNGQGNNYSDMVRANVPNSSRATVVRDAVPAGMGFVMPRNSLNIRTNGDVVTFARCELWKTVLAGPTENFGAPELGAMIPAKLPWLAGVAANFSKWRWRRFSVRYVATTGTTTTGGVGQGFGYDMLEGTPTSLIQVAAMDQFSYHAAWSSDTEDKVADTGRFSRDWYPYVGETVFNGLSGNDQNDYCPGYLSDFSGISSLTVNGEVGFLMAEYVVEFCDPFPASMQPS